LGAADNAIAILSRVKGYAEQKGVTLCMEVTNSKVAAEVALVDSESVLLLVLPIAHNLPLACPGIQGIMFAGAKVVLHGNTRPAEMFALIQKHRGESLLSADSDAEEALSVARHRIALIARHLESLQRATP